MKKIHESAIVDPGAELGDGAEIGPFAIVGPNVRIGAGCRILARAVIESDVVMGGGNVVGYGTIIGAPPQDFGHPAGAKSEVRIGDGNTFREYVTIHRATGDGTATVVGDGNFLMTGAHVGHNAVVGNRTIIANNCLLAGYVAIGDGAVLGGGTVFHQFMRVGRLAMVRGGTRFGKDIPPFVVADGENLLSGINAVGLRRAGMASEVRTEVRRLFREIFRSGRNVSQALEVVEREEWGSEAREMIQFIRDAKRRGVCVAARNGGGGEGDGDAE